MLGWSISARAWRSASNRAMTWPVSMPGLMTLSATLRRTGFSCSAMKTTPMPPSPICWSSLYGPITVPGPSSIGRDGRSDPVASEGLASDGPSAARGGPLGVSFGPARVRRRRWHSTARLREMLPESCPLYRRLRAELRPRGGVRYRRRRPVRGTSAIWSRSDLGGLVKDRFQALFFVTHRTYLHPLAGLARR